MTENLQPKNFEKAIAELEKLVKQIENNDIGLEVAFEKYQQGMTLIKFCQDKLKDVEQKVKILDEDINDLKDFNKSNNE